jgi:hypothetical protein
MVPLLTPDLVIYGMCNNDFLPTGVGQYEKRPVFPLPEPLKRFLLARTRLAGFISDAYLAFLLHIGVSADFHDDILKDFDRYQARFATDVKEINRFVRGQGLPPVVGMTLEQSPVLEGKGHRVSRIAERLMKEAGFEVVSSDGFYRRYDGRAFVVSHWEGHPNEEANAIFAGMLFEHLRGRLDVQRFALTPADPPASR